MTIAVPMRATWFTAACLLCWLGFPPSPSFAHDLPNWETARLYEGKIGSHPVVMSVGAGPHGELGGDYYYVSADPVALIELSGKRDDHAITLHEAPTRPSPRKGWFDCTMRGDGIRGTWRTDDGQTVHKVTLVEVSSPRRRAELRNTILDAADRDFLPSSSCDQEPPDAPPDESGCSPLACAISYEFKNDRIRSLRVWSSQPCGAYPNVETRFVTYDTQSLRQVTLWDEIAPRHKDAFTAYLRKEGIRRLAAARARARDVEWFTLFGGDAESSTERNAASDAVAVRAFVDNVFAAIDPLATFTEFYVAPDGVHLGRCGMWEFPHVAAALDFCDYIVMSHKEIRRYLKPRSILRAAASAAFRVSDS